MRYYELDLIVRQNTDEYRLYDWRQIEGMREDLASYGMGYNNVKAELVAYKELVLQLLEYRNELRAQKMYEVADKIRKLIADLDIRIEDNKLP